MKQYAIGVDMGGTNTAYALISRDGTVVERGSLPTTGHISAQVWAEKLWESLREMIERNGVGEEIEGIGIGAPCANTITGCIEAATDLPWPSPIPLKERMERLSGIKVSVANDANAAAMGERIYGAAKGVDNFIMLTLGTGVGSGIVCDGNLILGSRSFAGELGHIYFEFAKGRPCGCGREGCLQTVASAKGIVLTARKMLEERDIPSSLRSIPIAQLSSKDVAEAAQRGDLLAREIIAFTGRAIGEACATFAAFSDPELIVLFGGVAKAGRTLTDAAELEFRRKALHLYADKVRFRISELPDSDAALLGAAAMVTTVSGD